MDPLKLLRVLPSTNFREKCNECPQGRLVTDRRVFWLKYLCVSPHLWVNYRGCIDVDSYFINLQQSHKMFLRLCLTLIRCRMEYNIPMTSGLLIIMRSFAVGSQITKWLTLSNGIKYFSAEEYNVDLYLIYFPMIHLGDFYDQGYYYYNTYKKNFANIPLLDYCKSDLSRDYFYNAQYLNENNIKYFTK